MTALGPILAIDTATRRGTVAVGAADGRVLAERGWATEHRPGSALAQQLDEVLRAAALDLRDIGAIAVGLGPGSFTGLRVGLATAKVLAHALRRPIVGIGTAEALAWGAARATGPDAAGRYAIVLPAGASDHYLAPVDLAGDAVTSPEPPRLLPPGTSLRDVASGARLVAVDVPPPAAGDGALPPEALDLGRAALERLAEALLALAARALAAGRSDDAATLVPAYVALPRGVTDAAAQVRWSPDLR